MNPASLLWSPSGRIGRAAYAGGIVLNLAVTGVVLAIMFGALSLPPGQTSTDFAIGMTVVLFIWAKLALAAKRFHDLGTTGWMCLLLLIPVVALIVVLFLLLSPGEEHDNKYGPGTSIRAPT